MLLDLPQDLVEQILHYLDGKSISTLMLLVLSNQQESVRRVLLQRIQGMKLHLMTSRCGNNARDFLLDVALEIKKNHCDCDESMSASTIDCSTTPPSFNNVGFLSSRLAVLDYFEGATVNPDKSTIDLPIWIGSANLRFNTYDVQSATQILMRNENVPDDPRDGLLWVQVTTPFWRPSLLHVFRHDSDFLLLERTSYNFQTIPPMGRVTALLPKHTDQVRSLAQSLRDNQLFAPRFGGEHLSVMLVNKLQLQQRSLRFIDTVDPYNLKGNTTSQSDTDDDNEDEHENNSNSGEHETQMHAAGLLHCLFRMQTDCEDGPLEETIENIVSLLRYKSRILKKVIS